MAEKTPKNDWKTLLKSAEKSVDALVGDDAKERTKGQPAMVASNCGACDTEE